ncbi:hypothetical protein I4U23_008136 [Adineta vaga]|nr:hypothetical protein I4U23_008136 [Adineta vaga]
MKPHVNVSRIRYPQPPIFPTAVPEMNEQSSSKMIVIIVVVVVGSFLFLGTLAIALGLGLGFGLKEPSNPVSPKLLPTTPACKLLLGKQGCAPTIPTTLSSTTAAKTTTTITTSISLTTTFITTTPESNNWPFIVALYLRNQKICTGFLLTNRHVITSATCVYNLDETAIAIYFGTNILSNKNNRFKRTISSVAYPSTYRKGRTIDDIAVLTLARNVTMSSTVGVCSISKSILIPQVDDEGIVVGWNEASSSEKLQEADIRVENPSTCGLSTETESQFCSSYRDNDKCIDDQGRALLIRRNNQWVCAGIAIDDTFRCRSIGIYTRIGYYYEFIMNSIKR